MKIKLLPHVFTLLLFISISTVSSYAQQIGVGYYHSMIYCSSGALKTTGANWDGQLGIGTYNDTTKPATIAGLTNIIAIDGGDSHTIALRSDGTVWTWGAGYDGELGDSTYVSKTTPVQVRALSGIIAIAAGEYHSLAVKSDGTVWAWGYNSDGQLGDSTTIERNYPVQVHNITGVISVKAGSYHSLALKSDGTVWGWGYNGSGQLGDGTSTLRRTPVQTLGLTGVTAIAAAYRQSLAIKSPGTVWGWGNNGDGELGDGTYTNRITPVQSPTLSGMIAIECGEYHTLALKNNGTVWAWGGNYSGPLGNGTNTDSPTPVQVTGLTGITLIAAGEEHSLAYKNDGSYWAWGWNGDGQLGDGTYNDRNTPGQMKDCCTNLPGLGLSVTCVTMDSTAQGGTSHKTFKIKNTACGTLVVSSITSTNAAYTTTPASVSIAAYDSATITVNFSPTILGNNTGNFTIHNNVHDTTVCYSGLCVAASAFTYSPASFNVTLGCSDSLVSNVTLGNTGSGSLSYYIWNFRTTPVATCAASTGSNCCSYGILNVHLNTINNSSGNATLGYQNFTNISTTLKTSVSYTLSVTTAYNFEYVSAWIDWNGNGIFEAGEIVMNNLYPSSTIHTSTVTVPGGAISNTGLRMRVVSSDYNSPPSCGSVSYGQHEDYTIFINKWMSTTAILTGFISPGGTSIKPIKFNSTGLLPGIYLDTIRITTNDPAHLNVNIPLTMNVVGTAHMQLALYNTSTACLNLDSIMAYTTSLDSISVTNTGCDTLRLITVTATPAIYTVYSYPPTIAPGVTKRIKVQFAPIAAGSFSGILNLHTNVLDTAICLFGKCYTAPIISTFPTSFSVTLGCTDSLNSTLLIYNTGGSYLTYTSTIVNPTLISSVPTAACAIGVGSSCCSYGISNVHLNSINNTSAVYTPGYQDFTSISTALSTTTANTLTVTTSYTYEYVNAWIDWNNNGIFEATDIVMNNIYSGSTIHTSSITVPASAINNRNLRLRVVSSYYSNPPSCGFTSYGQAEDYSIYISNIVSLSSYTGIITPGLSTTVAVHFSSIGLVAGVYTGSITIASNDPLNNPYLVPWTVVVSGQGHISLSRNCFNMDSIMAYTTKKDSLYIRNTGCDTLHVTNITHLGGPFTPSNTVFNIPPNDSAKLKVTFAPIAAGTYIDTLTIINNDVTKYVCLKGKCYARPVESTHPTAIADTLGCCSTSTIPLTIYNTGGSNLTWNVTTGKKSAVFDGAGDYLYRGTTNLPTGSVMTAEAWIYPTAYNDASYNGIVSWGGRYCNGAGMLLSIQNNGRPSMATWCNDFVPTTGPTATLNQWNHIACVVNGTSVTLYMNGVAISGTLSLVPNVLNYNLAIGETDYHGRYFTGKIDEVRIFNRALTGAEILSTMNHTLTGTELGLKGYWNFDNGTANDLSPAANNLTFAGGVVTQPPSAPVTAPGLSLTFPSGSITPGDSATFNVSLSSCGLSIGNYPTQFYINTNDPLNYIDTIPVNLTVVGLPAIALTRTCLYLDSIMANTTHKDSLYIKNTGCANLIVSNITALTGLFTPSNTTYTIVPGDSAKLKVTFAPTTAGYFTDTLTILNNDVTKKVCLSGKCYPMPTIFTIPDSINVSVPCGDTLLSSFTINNSGGSVLNWSTNVGSGGGVAPTGYCIPVMYPSNSYSYINSVTTTGGTENITTAVDAGFTSISGTGVNYYPSAIVSQAPGGSFTLTVQSAGSGSNAYFSVWLDWNRNGVFDAAELMVNNNYHAGNTPVSHTITIPLSATLGVTRMRIIDWTNGGAPAPCGGLSGWYGETEDYNVGIGSPGLTIAPLTGSVVPAGSQTVQLEFDSRGLNNGIYYYPIMISSNDPLHPIITVYATLTVVGVGHIALSRNCMYLDSIMQYTSHTDSLYIKNIGCDTLYVTNITHLSSVYTLNSTVFTIPPADSAKLKVTFLPTAVGTIIDTLTILNDDVTKYVCLSGKCWPKPSACWNPDSVYVTIGCSDSVTFPFHLCNSGGSNLYAQLIGGVRPIKALIVAADYAAYANDVYAKLMATGKFSSIDIVLANSTTPTLAQLQQYDAALVWSNYGFANPTLLGNNLADYVDGGGGVVTAIFSVGGYDPIYGRFNTSNYWCINPSVGIASGTQTLGTVYNSSHPIMDGVSSFNGGSDSYRPGATAINPLATRIADWSDGKPLVATRIIGSARRVDLGMFPPSSDQYYTYWQSSTDGALLMANSLVWSSNATVSWMTISPILDTVPAGDTSLVNLTFYSTGLTAGNYSTTITIESNDPLNSSVSIPVLMNISGTGAIVLTENCLNLDSIMAYTIHTDSLYIKNTGCDTLIVTDITNVLNVYSVNSTSYSIIPGDSALLIVTFAPLVAGTYVDTLTILNSDVTKKVCLSGRCYPKPVQCHSPNSFNLHFTTCDDSISKQINVCNTLGGSNLNWNFTTSDGKSALFDGSGDYITLHDSLIMNHNTITVEAWFKTTSVGIIFSYQDNSYPTGPSNSVPMIYVGSDGKLRGEFWQGGVSCITTTGVVNNGVWHHVALTGNINTQSMYLDGTLVGTLAGTINNLNMSKNQIGGGYGPGWPYCAGGWSFFNGRIDEVRIFNYAKTQTQIQSAMNTELIGNESGLLEYLSFDTGNAQDLSPLGNNGIPSGNTSFSTPNAIGSSNYSTSMAFYSPSGTTSSGGNTNVNVVFNRDSINAGVHNYSIYLNSNDPLNHVDTISVIMTVDSLPPPAPVANNVYVCFGSVVPALTATSAFTSDTLRWYNDTLGLVYTGVSFNTGQTALGTYTYYVTSTDTLTRCESRMDTVVLHINPAPAVPVASNQSACFGTAIPSLTATGTTLLWYSDASLSTLVHTGSSYYTGVTAIGTYNFYVSDSVAGCPKSAADTVTLTIRSLPPKPIANDVTVCLGSAVPSLSAIGIGSDTIKWYNSFLAYVYTGTPYNTGIASSGVFYYYATQTDTVYGCESLKDTAILTIQATPQPLASNVSVCFGLPVPALSAIGTNLQWYNSAMTLVYSGNPYNPGTTAVGIDTFYVTQTLSGCQSTMKMVTVSINPIPGPPLASDLTSCFGQPTPALNAIGTGILWYTDASLTTLAYTGNPYNTGITAAGTYTYYATQTAIGCPSLADTVTLTIHALPAPPISSNNYGCFGMTIPSLSATSLGSDTIHWYSNAGLTSLLFTGNTFNTGITAAGVYNYYVTQTDTVTGCRSNALPVSLTINIAPGIPVVSDTGACYGTSIPSLVSTGTIVQWYNTTTLMPVIHVGNTYATGDTAVGSYTYYITDSTEGCPASAPDTAVLTINFTPASPATSGNVAICFGTSNPTFTATGTSLNWYSNAALTTLVATGTSYTPTVTTPSIYTYYVTQSVGSCSSSPSIVIFTINFTPPVSVADTSVDFGLPTPDLIASGTNITWYDTALIIVSTNDTFATGQIAIGSYTYYVTQTMNGCESTMDTVVLIINPSYPTAPNQSGCFGLAIPDLTAIGTEINWYSDASLTTLVDTGSTFATGNTAVGVYTYYATQTINGIQSPAATVTLTINAIPAAPVASGLTGCFGGTIPNLTATGTNIQWSDSVPTIVYSGTPYSTGQTAVGIYTYTVTQTVLGCQSPANTVTLTIYAIPSTPLASDETICFGTPTPDLTSTGSNINWTDSLGTLVGTGSPYSTGITAPGIYNYFVTQTNLATGCASLADTSTLTINFTPPPVAPDLGACAGHPVPDLVATGTGIEWYDNTMTSVFSGTPFATGQTALGVYLYFVTQTNSSTGCTSTPDSVILTIATPPLAPVTSDVDGCFGNTIPPLTAVGTAIHWYSDAGLTTLQYIGNPFYTTDTAIGSVTYYATQSNGGCEGPSSSATLTIHPAPLFPGTSGNASICLGQSIPAFTATGANIQWYSDSTTTTLVGTGSSYTPTVSAPGVYTYYVTQTVGICSSHPVALTLTINYTPPPVPLSSSVSIPYGAPTPDLIVTGSNVIWYDTAMVSVSVNDTFATGNTAVGVYTYYVTQTLNGCESTPDTVVLNIYPGAPLAYNNILCYGINGDTLIASGLNINWYSDSALTTLVYSGSPFPTGQTAAGSYVYYVTQTLFGLESPATADTLVILPLPSSPVASDQTICFGVATPDLTAVGSNLEWYDNTMASVYSGSPYATGITAAGVYTYYVTQFGGGCASNPDTVILTINALPSAPVAANQSVCSGGVVPDLTATGTNIQWYDISNTLIASGSPYATGVTASGIYTYYVTQTDGSTGCESYRDTVTLTIQNVAPPVATDISVCYGVSVPPFMAAGSNVNWYDVSMNNVGTGNTFNTGITAAGTYTYLVTDSLAGCAASAADTATLTIVALPVTPVVTSDTTCYGRPASLSATGLNPHWYSDNTLLVLVGTGSPFTPPVSSVGTYTYYVTDYNSLCGNSLSVTASLIIHPQPLVTTNISAITLLTGHSTTLIAYNAVSYTWAPAAGLSATTGSTVTATPSATTTYTVTGTNIYGCTDTATIVVTISTGIDEYGSLQDVTIYPNPAEDEFTIEFYSSLSTPINIYLFNAIGEKISAVSAEGVGVTPHQHKYTINTEALDAGVYFVEIVTERGSMTKRLVLIK